MDNIESFLLKKPKSYFILNCIVIFVVIFLVLLMMFKKSYDIYVIKGTIECQNLCIINSQVSPELILEINNGEFLKINKKSYLYKIKEIAEVEIDYVNMVNYQRIKLETNLIKNLQKNNLVIQILIYTNKESMLRKIVKKFI